MHLGERGAMNGENGNIDGDGWLSLQRDLKAIDTLLVEGGMPRSVASTYSPDMSITTPCESLGVVHIPFGATTVMMTSTSSASRMSVSLAINTT